jgi:hypothetical protein
MYRLEWWMEISMNVKQIWLESERKQKVGLSLDYLSGQAQKTVQKACRIKTPHRRRAGKMQVTKWRSAQLSRTPNAQPP